MSNDSRVSSSIPKIINANTVLEATPMEVLVDVIDHAFAHPPVAPERHHHTMEVHENEPDATLLLMPAWRPGKHVGIKIATVFPGANAMGLPAVQAVYILSHGESGQLLAIIDGSMLTARRTAAASAVASRYLAKEDAETLLMVGTGAQAPHLIEAHSCVRPIRKVLVWGRQTEKAKNLIERVKKDNIEYEVAPDLETAAKMADIISSATLSEQPLILGAWLKPGVHVDLVGSFKPHMRETDNEAIQIARVFVDTRAGALSEAGDLIQPIAANQFSEESVVAELSELCSGKCEGRTSSDEITLFKSVGASIEDLAAAEMLINLIQ